MIFLSTYKLSSTFEIVGSKLIGRYDKTSIGFLPGLGIIIICAIFNDLGQYSSRSVALNIQGVTGGTDQTSAECSLGQTIPI